MNFFPKTGKISVLLILFVLLAVVSVGALDQVIGEAGLMLNGQREHVRTQETNLGNLVTDVIRERSGADIAVYNGGGIRASADLGEITLEEAMEILAFQNQVVTLEMSGADVIEMLEHGLSSYPEVSGKFLQVSGIRFYFDPSKSAGERVERVMINNKPLDRRNTYTVATNEFLAAGGDEYTMLENASQVETFDKHDQAMFIQYIQENTPVFPVVEGRIVVVK